MPDLLLVWTARETGPAIVPWGAAVMRRSLEPVVPYWRNFADTSKRDPMQERQNYSLMIEI
jgi:hypothetical protein